MDWSKHFHSRISAEYSKRLAVKTFESRSIQSIPLCPRDFDRCSDRNAVREAGKDERIWLVRGDGAKDERRRKVSDAARGKNGSVSIPSAELYSRIGLHSCGPVPVPFHRRKPRLMPGVYEVARSRTDDTDTQESGELASGGGRTFCGGRVGPPL